MSGVDVAELEKRLRRLEDDRAIRDLKARYLRAADLKDPDAMADTFIAKGAVIAFEGFPRFDDRAPFIEIYRTLGCAPGIFDIHHGGNGVIRFEDEDRASGLWSLVFHNINLADRTLTQFGVEYDDLYVRENDEWRIACTTSRRKSALIQKIDETGAPLVTAMGDAPENFG